MDYLRDKSLRRLDDFLEKLNNFILQNDDDNQLSQENTSEYVPYLIVKYVISICNGEDFEPSSDSSNEKIEESYESQKLVEFDCNEFYTSRMSLVLKNFTSSNLSLETFFDNNSQFYCHTSSSSTNNTDKSNNSVNPVSYVIYSKKEVSGLLKSGHCKLAVDLIGDVPLSDKGVGINYLKHGKLVLKRFTFLLNRVCPLRPELHINYIKSHLSQDKEMLKMIDLAYLDSSRPWIMYWSLHSLLLLRHDIQSYKQRSLNSIMKCWDNEFGGFGGGEYQRAHVATTYAALCVLKMFNSVHMVDVELLYSFLMDMKSSDGSFSATYGGERDTRSTYCAIASAYMAGNLTEELTENTLEYIISCQTYEGGLSSEPYLEAHAGYTYCGLACIAIIITNTLNTGNYNTGDSSDTVSNVKNKLDLMKVYEWCVNRLTPQFGFQGRPHKLVDSCYSFWVGSSILIIEQLFNQLDKFYGQNDTTFYNRGDRKLYEELLKCYLLVVAQTGKGFRDKPGKPSDLYHTCYSLSYLNLIDNNLPHDILLNLTT
ncbi:Prenyltransferase and squalene oxidase repeat family protein [Theileria parva strain Muguga]|uniref:Protein farnesyltransferase subunit beta n=1 Tax=Theileria parva TaxID=5875 RepID=Q4N428_THEPA|nr:farnesyltransferase subunit beta [Theileria parva strain Muguga]EAN33095.1 Prenyltransferase and squalene oxidase repeat family protein [Theileria parva strain Muguga]|eukprot:XP_765378.1 farnesyltransferase subunit beta [Theileria parva strain Muguga]